MPAAAQTWPESTPPQFVCEDIGGGGTATIISQYPRIDSRSNFYTSGAHAVFYVEPHATLSLQLQGVTAALSSTWGRNVDWRVRILDGIVPNADASTSPIWEFKKYSNVGGTGETYSWSEPPHSWTNGSQGRYVTVLAFEIIQRTGGGYQQVDVTGYSSAAVCGFARTPSESFGANASMPGDCPCNGNTDHSVNTRTGNEHFRLPGVSVGSQGPGLDLQIGYNSLDAGYDGPVGHGWRHSYDMRLVDDPAGTKTVVQETGATVTFEPDGSGGWQTADRMNAELSPTSSGEWEFVRGRVEHFTFNSSGQLLRVSDHLGQATELAYAGGLLDLVTEPGGRQLDFDWSNGRVDVVTVPAGDGSVRQIHFDYTNGDLTSYTEPGGGTWTLGYDGSHRLTSAVTPRHAATGTAYRWGYDTEGRVAWEEDELGRRTDLVYDSPVPGATRVIEHDGDARVDHYNSLGQRTGITLGHGSSDETSTEFAYDPFTFMVTKRTDGRGKEWHFAYADTVNPHLVTTATDPLGRTTDRTYTALGQIASATDDDNITTSYGYLANGNLDHVTVADGVVGLQATTSFVYAHPTWPGAVTSTVDQRGKQWLQDWDAITGDLTSRTDPEGNTTSFTYNPSGWVSSVTAPKGNVVGATAESFTTHVTYHDSGLRHTVTNPADEVTTYTYDGNHNLKTVTDNDNETVSYSFNDADDLVAQTRPDTTTIDYGYHADGRLAFWESGTNDRWASTYDAVGRLKTSTDPNGKITTYGYDANHNLVSDQQPGGDCGIGKACVTYGYDDANQLTSIDYSDSVTPDVTSITYDGVGRRDVLTLATSPATSQDWDWDERGRLTGYTDTSGNTTGYGWDDGSLLTSILYPGETTPVTYGYDDAGRMTSVLDWLGNTTTFVPDEHGNVESIVFPSATTNVDEFTYDGVDRMTGVTWERGITQLGAIDYDPRDPEGLVATADASGLPGVDELYGYDSLDRLTGRNADAAAYDDAGNMTGRFDGATQAFDPTQQLCWSSPSGGSGACTTPPGDATTYSYDSRGNRTAAVDPNPELSSAFVYDQANRLTESTTPRSIDGGQYHGLVPTRVLDTRPNYSTGVCEPSPCDNPAAGQTIKVKLAGEGGIPSSGVRAVSFNLSAIDPAGTGYAIVYPSGVAKPNARSLSYTGTEDASNRVTVGLGPDGMVTIYVGQATADLYLDVTGWYSEVADETGGTFHPLTPTRVADTRPPPKRAGQCPTTTAQCVALGANTPKEFRIAGLGGVPASNVGAVSLNVHVFTPGADGYVKAYRHGTDPAPSRTFGFESGLTTSGSVDVKLDPGGTIDLKTNVNNLNVAVDVIGYWTTPAGEVGAQFVPLDTHRVMSTTTGAGVCDPAPCARLSSGHHTITLAGQGEIPGVGVDAVIANITAVNATSSGSVTAWQAGLPRPQVRTVAAEPNRLISNLATVDVDDDGRIEVYVDGAAQSVDLYIDVQGYYLTRTQTVAYRYDGDGLRAAKSSEGETTTYAWSAAGGLPLLLTETTGAGATHVIYGPGGMAVAQVSPDDTVVYYHRDQLGSTRLVTDESGNPLGTYTYDPYGAVAASTGTFDPLLDYAGQYTDGETGFQYLRARYYDPDTGQFLTRDPLLAVTQDPYGYALNNPVNATDPTGLCGIFGDGPCTPGGIASDLKKRGGQALNSAGDAASAVVRSTPVGRDLDLIARLTGHSAGVCAGGNVTVPYIDRSYQLCYTSTPSGEHGFVLTAGAGVGAPSVTGYIGPMFSNAQSFDDLRGRGSYAYGGAGPISGGAAWGTDSCGDTTWSASGGYTPPGFGFTPFGFSGGAGEATTYAHGRG